MKSRAEQRTAYEIPFSSINYGSYIQKNIFNSQNIVCGVQENIWNGFCRTIRKFIIEITC